MLNLRPGQKVFFSTVPPTSHLIVGHIFKIEEVSSQNVYFVDLLNFCKTYENKDFLEAFFKFKIV